MIKSAIHITLVLVVLCLVLQSQVRAADIYWELQPGFLPSAQIHIEGQIVAGDEEKFRTLILSLIKTDIPVLGVTVYSSGGSVSPAIDIGHQIRLLKATTSGPWTWGKNTPMERQILCARASFDRSGRPLPQRKGMHWGRKLLGDGQFREDARCICASACFLIWAAGYRRYGNWFGLHRPFFDKAEYAKLSWQEAERVYNSMLGEIKSYLYGIGIPTNIVQKMTGANSTEMYFLSVDEGNDLQNNAGLAVEELTIARCRNLKEYSSEWSDCAHNVRVEIYRDSLPAYLARYNRD